MCDLPLLMTVFGAEETAPAETVMDAFYQKPEPSGQRWRVQATTSALERAQLFGSDIQAPHSRAAERFRATGGRTGEPREDWQGAFVVTHIGRARLIMRGAH